MTIEDYQLLIWMLGDRLLALNLFAGALLVTWYAVAVSIQAVRRFARYLDYKLDAEFWNDLLPG